ncbi:hypothetical protein FB45DRAFT_716854, partial [Roridomyces roridus]
LPPEVVSDILIHTLPPYPVCPPLTGPASPIALAHICGTWREIALSTPQLWRSIWLRHTDHLQIPIEVVQPWLARSGSCPLSIQIESEQWGASMTPGPWEAIRPFIQRSEQGQLVITATGHMLSFFLKGSMPTLRSLSVAMKNPSLIPPDVTSLDFPRLRTVSLTWLRYPVDWLPWAQLTSLTFKVMYSPNCIPVLRDAIHLVDLIIIDCDFTGTANAGDIPLTQLKTLVATCDVVDILNLLSVPALQTLQLYGADLGDEPVGALGSLISRSGFKLQKLRICGRYRLPVPKETFLGAFPTI